MADMAPGSAFLQANPYAPAPEQAQPVLAGVEAPVEKSTPSGDPVVASWRSDPEFSALPPERKAKIVTNYFHKNIADGDFQALPPDRQARIIQNFMSVNLGDTGYVRAPVNPTPRAPVSAPTPKMNAREVGFTPEQSAMFGPAARDKQDIEEAGRSAALNPAIMDATATVGSQEAAKQKINDESLLDKPQQFGPQTTVTEGPAGQLGPEYDENGKRNILRDAYHAAAMGKMLVEDAMAGLAGAGFGRESATAKYYRNIADKTAGQTGIDQKSNIGGIGVLDTMRGTAQLAGDMALLIPSGMAVSAAAQPAFSLLRPAAAAAMASAEGQLASRVLHGAATGAVYSIPQDPKTAWENIKLFAAFEAAAAGAHALGQYGGREFGALTKHIVKTTGVPDKVYFSPTKVRDIMGASADVRGGVSPEEYAIFQDMQNYGLKNSDIIKATREGLTIELPTEMALKIADKPYYARIKEAFGVEPYARTLESEMSDPRFYTGQGGSMKPEPAKDATLDLMSPVPGVPRALPGADMPRTQPEQAPPAAPSGPQPTVPVIPGEGVPNGQVQEVLAPEGNGLPGQAGAGAPEVGRPGYGGGLSGGVPQQGPIVAGPGPQGPLVQQGQQPVVQAEGPAPVLGQPADAAPGFAGGQEVVGQAEPVAVPGVGQQPVPGVPAGQPVAGQQPAPVEPAFHPDIHEHVDGTPEPAPVEEYEAPAEPARPMSKEERAYRKGVLEQFQESQKNNPIHRLSTKLRLGYDPLMESPPDRKAKDYKAPHGLNLEDAYRAFGKQALEGISPGLLKKSSPVMVDDLVEWWGLDGPDQVLDALRYNKGKAEQAHMDGVPRFEAEAEVPSTDYYDDIPFGQDDTSVSEKPGSETQAPEQRTGETQVKRKDVLLPKEEEPILDLTEEDKREPWEMTLREFAGRKPSPPQIVGGKTVTSGDLGAWNKKKILYDESVAQAYADGKLTLDEVRVKTPDQWLKLKGKGEVKPPVAPAKEPGVVKPAVEPQKPKPVVSKTLKDAGLVVAEKVSQKTGKPYWEISGKTYDNKDAIKSLPGVKFGGKVWRAFNGDPTAALEQALADAEGAKAEKAAEWEGKLGPKPKAEAEPKAVGGRGLGEGTIGIQIKTLRQKLDDMPDISPVKPGRSVGDPTRALIQKGEGAIPQEVLNAQVEDIGSIAAAFRVGKSAFVLASDPGMGKTFVIAGALKEIARNHVGPLMWVTQNRRLIEQIKADIGPFGLNNRLQFITYTDMSQIHAGKKTSDMKIDGAVIAWDEGHSVKNTSDAGEESGAARADLGQKYMQRAKFNILASATPFENPTQMGYIAASGVFDQLTEMTGLGRAISGTPFSDFALAFGAGQRKIRVKGGREKQILEWERGQTPAERRTQNENAMAARMWLEKQGMLAQREMKLEPGMVTTELKSVPPTDANVALADNFAEAMARAVEEAGVDRTLRRNLAGYATNTLKRIMEDAKVDAAITEAKEVIAQGKQAVIFVETRAKKEISGKDYPGMAEVMRDWEAERSTMGGDAGKPPYSRFQMAVAQALHEAGLEESLESTVKRITEGVGSSKTAIFTGDRTENAANADLDLWLNNKKPLLVATMAKGGTGLSLHSRRPGDPERVLIGLNMPWTATVMKQVLGRVTRLGMLKPSEVHWLFLDHDFERGIAAKVGGRMQDMGAVVSGKIPSMGTDIEAFDFDAPTEGTVLEDIIGDYQAAEVSKKMSQIEPFDTAGMEVEEPQVVQPDVQEAIQDPEVLADLARAGTSISGTERVALARHMAEGVAFGRDGFDMEASPYGGLVYFQDVSGGRVAFHEVDGKLEFEPQLQFSRVASRGKVVTDPRLIKRILSKDILNQDPARTVVSELFQNAIDSLIYAKWPKDAHVEVALQYIPGSDDFRVGIKDNGIGMTARDVKTKFLAIGAKGKEGTETIGGYGMAKVAFLFYPKEVFVRTTKGGKTTEITATRDELMDGDFPVVTREAREGERGTTYIATMPSGMSDEGARYDYSIEFESAMREYAKGIRTKNLTVTTWGVSDYDSGVATNYQDNDWMPAQPGDSKAYMRHAEYKPSSLDEMPKVTPSVEVVSGENRAMVHFIKDNATPEKTGDVYLVPAQVYSKGMPLPALKTARYQSIDGIPIPAAGARPDFIVAIDFVKTYEPEHDMYPFRKNRTVVLRDIGDKLSKVVGEYIEKLNQNATDERVAEFQEMISTAPVMGGTPVLIPKDSYSDVAGARGVVEKHEKFFSSYGKLLSTWSALLESAKLKNDTRIMITLDRGVYGWHAPNGLTGEGKIIAINPLTMMTKGEWNNKPLVDTDEYKVLIESGESRERILGSASVHTLLHENVHNRESNHSESFTSELMRQSTLMGHLRLATMESKATAFYKEFADEIESIAGDLDRVREGGDAGTGSAGADVDASRVPPRGIEPVGPGAGAAEGAVQAGGRDVLVEARVQEGRGEVGEGQQKKLTVSDVQAEVDKISKAKFPHTMVEVVPSWIDLPAEVSMGIQRAMDTSQVEALYDPQTKKMYLLADRLLKRADVSLAVIEGAMHENLHRGIDAWRREIANSWGGSFKLANERIDGALNNAYDANKEAVDDLAEGDYKGSFDMGTRYGRARATEEWFARQANQKGKWYDRFVAAMRDFLRKVMEKLGHTLKWTDVETRAFISRAHRASKRFEQHDRRVNEAMGRNGRETLRGMVQRTRPDLAENMGQVQFALFKNPLKGMTEGERTFALQVHELYDRAMLDVNVSLKNLQKKVQDLAGVSHDSTKARRLDMAMLIYRDLKNSDAAHVQNPLPVADRILAFKRWAAAELATRSGDSKLRLQEFLRDLEQAQNLTQAQRDFVDQDMEAAFRTTTLEFQRLGKLKGQPIKDYVFRKLTPPDDRPVESSGAPSAAGSPVKSFSTGLMRRKYPTLLDAMQDGYELAPEVRGITNSWKEITTDAVKIAATTRFLQDGMSTGVLSTKNPGDWLPLRSPSLKVWRPTASVKTIIRDNPGLHDTLAAKNDVIGNYSRRLFVTQPEVTWAVFSGQGRRAAAVFDDEADARLFATQLVDSRVEYREGLNVFEKVPFYAPPAIANAINLMTAQQAGKFFSKPLGKSLTYLNGTLKPWMLLGDFFHHQSLMRSWTFGGPHDILGSLMYGSAVLDAKGRPTAQAETSAAKRVVGMLRGAKNSVSWRKAILSGLELIEERNPIIQKLVGKGLTFPSMADMTGHNMTKAMGIFETLVRAMGSQRAADAVAVGKILRSRSEHFLFATIDAGFKAQWAYTYFMHQLRHEISRGGTPDVEKIAEIVADAANTAFGGQHLGRAGRDPDLTKFLHLIMLAPDWAITQLKPAFAAVPGLDKVIARVLGEMPPPPGRDAFYRVFLAKQLLAAAVATLLAQVLINGDSEEGPFQMYREQFSDLPTAARLRWAMVDVTRLYRKVNEIREGMGLEPIDIEPGTRYMFNLPGFMIAPLRLFELGRFIAAKGSPLVRVITPYVSGADWRDRPYKSVSDLKKSVEHLDRKSSRSLVKGTRDENPRDISQFPAILMANVRDAQPLQIGQMLRWLQGEEDGLTATIKSLGVDFTVARNPRTNYKKFMEISKLSGEEYKEIKRSIYKKDYDPNKLPENDVEAYAAVALKSAIHKTRVQTSKIREAVEEAKLNPDYTNEARRRRVEMLRKTEDQMYRNVVLYHEAYTEGMKRHTITVTPAQVEQLRKDLAAEE